MDMVNGFIQVATFLMGVVITIVAVVRSDEKKQGQIDLLKLEIKNHKEAHMRLDDRLTAHESRIDNKLDAMNTKMDELKDLIIERTEK